MLRGPQGLLETARRGGVRNPRGVLSRSDGSISRAAELHLSVHAQMPMPTKRAPPPPPARVRAGAHAIRGVDDLIPPVLID